MIVHSSLIRKQVKLYKELGKSKKGPYLISSNWNNFNLDLKHKKHRKKHLNIFKRYKLKWKRQVSLTPDMLFLPGF